MNSEKKEGKHLSELTYNQYSKFEVGKSIYRKKAHLWSEYSRTRRFREYHLGMGQNSKI